MGKGVYRKGRYLLHLPQEMKRDTSSASDKSGLRTEDVSAGQTVWVGLADTTWRVAVPTVLFSGLGIAADLKFETMPLWTLVGLAVGLAAAGALVWRQVKALEDTGAKR